VAPTKSEKEKVGRVQRKKKKNDKKGLRRAQEKNGKRKEQNGKE